MKKIMQLNWLKWLPIVGNLFFGILFYIKLNEYLHSKYTAGTDRFGDPLYWYDLFANAVEITLLVSIICSFFIKNKWLKWLSVITGVVTLVAIYYNVGKFNPY